MGWERSRCPVLFILSFFRSREDEIKGDVGLEWWWILSECIVVCFFSSLFWFMVNVSGTALILSLRVSLLCISVALGLGARLSVEHGGS